ncbi:MAG: hypothetical protein KGL79_02515, partial [Acidobacteriota bacterium]|nr:hypothetical protein [Acidobacteriota bacterium]
MAVTVKKLLTSALSFMLLVGVSVVTSAHAATPVPASSLGYDVSFPQCNNPSLPPSPGFGIVGVNNGHPFSTNPCLVNELRWSQSSLSGQPNFYTNTDDPGPANSSSWPRSQQSPKICAGANTTACAYDYGWNAARASFAAAIAAEASAGSPAPHSTAVTARWWLDVETGNAWESLGGGYGPSPTSYANDASEIEGELAYFTSVGVSALGVYATGLQWHAIVGNPAVSFATIQAWMPGYATLAQAQAACLGPSFLGGRVAMIQYPSGGLDGDLACSLISGPTSASVSVAGSASFTTTLSVAGETSPTTFTQSAGAPSLNVAPSGVVTTGATLSPGTYVATGTSLDALGNTGTFSFTLVVGVISQGAPTSGAVTVAASSSFSAQLVTSGGDATTAFVKTAGSPALSVSSSGLVSPTQPLTAGTYRLSGTTLDQAGDHGVFRYTLVVGALAQGAPIRSVLSANATATFSTQLVVNGASGPVTFTQTTGAPSLVVSPSGLVTTSGALAPGSYVTRGTTSDASGDQGTYFFNLVVNPVVVTPITQSAPLQASTTSTNSAAFTDQLVVTGNQGLVTFTQTSGAPSLVVSSSGFVTTSGALATGTYDVQGTTSDPNGDQGTFSFTLDVGVVATTPLGQGAPIRASLSADATAT